MRARLQRAACTGAAATGLRQGRSHRRARTLARTFVLIAVLSLATPVGARAQPQDLSGMMLVDSLPASTDVPAPAAVPAPPRVRATSSPSSNSLTGFDDPEREGRTWLPFAGNPAPRTYPEVSVGMGVAYYVSSLRGAEPAFLAVEDSIRRSGYSVPVESKVHDGGMYVLSLNVNTTPRLGATFQFGETGDQDNDVKLIGALVWGRWAPPDSPGFSLSAGAGGGLVRFRFTRKYGVVISPTGSGGSYTTLDYIRLEGNSAYATIAGRAAFELTSRSAFEGTLQYMGAGDVASDIPGAGRQSVNVSGLIMGLSYRVSF